MLQLFPDTTEDCSSVVTKKKWVRFSKDLVFTFADKELVLAGETLDNRHINLSQNTRQEDYNQLHYRQSSTYRKQENDPNEHSLGDHWIVGSNNTCY